LSFIVKYNDKDENFMQKEISFKTRYSAEETLVKFEKYGHTEVSLDNSSESNGISLVIRIIGIVIIIMGIVFGFVQGQTNSEYNEELNFSIALFWWIGSIVAGFLFIGFAEIIRLLDAINKKFPVKK
jgi:amino acid transporter